MGLRHQGWTLPPMCSDSPVIASTQPSISRSSTPVPQFGIAGIGAREYKRYRSPAMRAKSRRIRTLMALSRVPNEALVRNEAKQLHQYAQGSPQWWESRTLLTDD